MERKKFTEPELNTVEGLTAKLIEVNARLQASEAERTRMLENISHDLRAPLTAIRSCVDYLLEYKDGRSEEYEHICNLLDVRTRMMETLVNDLYYLTCLDSRQDDFDYKYVKLGPFLEEYFFNAQVDNRYNERELILEVPEDYSIAVRIDTGRMVRVLDNLFTNALKYSKEGDRIILGAYTEAEDAVFYVQDTGIGIAKEHLDKIFDRMYMADYARTPGNQKSSGLGLSIVQSIIKRHGGRVTCNSTLGKGSRFTVYLPLQNTMEK